MANYREPDDDSSFGSDDGKGKDHRPTNGRQVPDADSDGSEIIIASRKQLNADSPGTGAEDVNQTVQTHQQPYHEIGPESDDDGNEKDSQVRVDQRGRSDQNDARTFVSRSKSSGSASKSKFTYEQLPDQDTEAWKAGVANFTVANYSMDKTDTAPGNSVSHDKESANTGQSVEMEKADHAGDSNSAPDGQPRVTSHDAQPAFLNSAYYSWSENLLHEILVGDVKNKFPQHRQVDLAYGDPLPVLQPLSPEERLAGFFETMFEGKREEITEAISAVPMSEKPQEWICGIYCRLLDHHRLKGRFELSQHRPRRLDSPARGFQL